MIEGKSDRAPHNSNPMMRKVQNSNSVVSGVQTISVERKANRDITQPYETIGRMAAHRVLHSA